MTLTLSFPPLRTLTLGLAGCGNMGAALAGSVLEHPELRRLFPLVAYDPSETARNAVIELGACPVNSLADLARASDIILVAVKPPYVAGVLREILPVLKAEGGADKAVLSIAAGVNLASLRAGVEDACPVIRVMPNTLASVGQASFGLCFGPGVPPDIAADVRFLLGTLGQLVELDESRMNAFTALAGSGPAYVFHFLESLIEAGVRVGLPRDSSRDIAMSLLRGGVMLAEQTGLHPAVLREQVSSPGGTTVAAINHLDRTGVRGHLVDAVCAAMARGVEMEKGG